MPSKFGLLSCFFIAFVVSLLALSSVSAAITSPPAAVHANALTASEDDLGNLPSQDTLTGSTESSSTFQSISTTPQSTNVFENLKDDSTKEDEEVKAEAQVDSQATDTSSKQKDTQGKTSNTVEQDVSVAAITVQQPPSPARPHPPLVTGCRTQGQIAVTYSEGPSDATAKIVHQLNDAGAHANFFINATWQVQYAMVAQNIYNGGHFIGMTYRVKNDDSASLSEDEIRRDIINDARIIETLIHVAPKYVRLHYTPKKDLKTEAILDDLGFVLVGHNLDSKDYQKRAPIGPDSVASVYLEAFHSQKDTYDAKGSFISIQYDIPDTGSSVGVPHVIDTINKEGYTMVRLDGCLNDPKPYKKSAESREYIADKFTFNTPGYIQGQEDIPEEVIEAAKAEAAKSKVAKSHRSDGVAISPLKAHTLLVIGLLFLWL
ncbi:hypothetical protein CLU79DRAFT_840823 [Phycomyces nitens]|nr:hypothetical protein CLU79DRAFT_840823 [Phycomyces nitens]